MGRIQSMALGATLAGGAGRQPELRGVKARMDQPINPV
jgi:hypothetical protein